MKSASFSAILLAFAFSFGSILCHQTVAFALEWGVDLHPQNQEYIQVWVYSGRNAASLMMVKVRFYDEDGRDLGMRELTFPHQDRNSTIVFPGETKQFALYHGIREADDVEGIDIKWGPVVFAPAVPR